MSGKVTREFCEKFFGHLIAVAARAPHALNQLRRGVHPARRILDGAGCGYWVVHRPP